MMGKIKIHHKRPKGFKNFTDNTAKNKIEFKKSGYVVRVGKNPYTKMGGKVLFYKRKRR